MARVVFLSQDSMDGYVCDDDVAVPACAELGIEIETLSWRADVDWSDYDAVIVRSTWDYQRHAEAFLDALARIEGATQLANARELMRWNLDKRYLAELQKRGVPIVPTEFGQGMTAEALDARLAATTSECVIKPAVSAGAERTYRVSPDAPAEHRARIVAGHAGSVWMWQPFLPQIVDPGEYSLFYFNGVFSHAIIKTPKPGDFRVQEEFGGDIRLIDAPEAMCAAADRVMASLETDTLYARVDLVDDGAGGYWLIELELIEPSLYLRKDPGAPARFAQAVADWLN
ncbi:MAG: hypothetical protein AAFR09_01955 [Pseudomonadota bacterium]